MTATSEDDRASPDLPASLVERRLWTPWRMRYVAGGASEEGCLFCNRLAADDDAHTLILHRADRAFVIMNLFPYNTGHVMLVPNAHIASPEAADPGLSSELAALRGPVLRALRRALSCDGFNLGMNVGAVAGAGVADHLHEHVVPRWQGDANFMPILASTMVLPELIPVTYAKLRAEIARELGEAASVMSLILSPDQSHILVDAASDLPQNTPASDEPLWRAALRDASERGARDPRILGWAGTSRAGEGPVTLLIQAALSSDNVAPGNRLEPIANLLSGPHGEIVRTALARAAATP
jgi:ATP adenylyltransferase